MKINAPLVNQRNQTGNDGQPPESGDTDCVPASLTSMARGLAPDRMRVGGAPMTADYAKDQVYGQGWKGLQDPARYVAFFARYGLRLTSHSGAAKDRYYFAAQQIMAGRPVLLSIPSDWNDNPPTSRFAHMIAGCDATDRLGTHLTCMNPWGGFYQTQARDWWVERLATCAYQLVWVMEGGENVSWHQQPDRTGKDDSGHTCGEGMLNYLQKPENAALLAADGLLDETYYGGGARAFLPLAAGTVVRGVRTGTAWTFDTNGAQVLADVWALYQAAKSAPPPPTGSDPLAGKALDQLTALKALLGEL